MYKTKSINAENGEIKALCCKNSIYSVSSGISFEGTVRIKNVYYKSKSNFQKYKIN